MGGVCFQSIGYDASNLYGYSVAVRDDHNKDKYYCINSKSGSGGDDDGLVKQGILHRDWVKRERGGFEQK